MKKNKISTKDNALLDIIEKFDGEIMLSHSEVISKKMEKAYPETMEEIRKISDDLYKLFAKKQHDYGPGNIMMNGDKELALLAIAIRMNDKVQRLLNLLRNTKDAENEPIIDAFQDASIYGIIAMLVIRDKWGK